MKNTISLTICSLIMIFLFPFPDRCWSQDQEGLYNMFSNKTKVKVFVAEVINSTGENKIDVLTFKKELENAFSLRKSISFELTNNRQSADISVDCDVIKYYWSATDPVDMLLGTGAIVYDVITTENYAYLEAFFRVTDIKTNKLLWKRRLKIDLTKQKMSHDESRQLINKRAVKVFMRECFSKKRR